MTFIHLFTKTEMSAPPFHISLSTVTFNCLAICIHIVILCPENTNTFRANTSVTHEIIIIRQKSLSKLNFTTSFRANKSQSHDCEEYEISIVRVLSPWPHIYFTVTSISYVKTRHLVAQRGTLYCVNERIDLIPSYPGVLTLRLHQIT